MDVRQDQVEIRTIETRTHGRYLVNPPEASGSAPMLVGFHGYGESAATHLDALSRIPGTGQWLLVAVQGLHRFYRRDSEVVSSWMTSQDRELAIADNLAYVRGVVDACRREFATTATLVFAGFSQGAAMAFRAAAQQPAAGLIVNGGDVPPDIAGTTAVPLPAVLYGRGRGDELYGADVHARDLATLAAMGVSVESLTFDGRHEMAAEFLDAAGRALARWRDR
jgi:predicted esterase